MDDTANTPSAVTESDAPTKPSLAYEETPIIDPTSGQVAEHDESQSAGSDATEDIAAQSASASVVPEAAQIFAPSTSSRSEQEEPSRDGTPPQTKRPGKNYIGTIIFVVLLFGLGVWLSMQLRSFFTPAESQQVAVPTAIPLPESVTTSPAQATTSATADTTWVTNQIISGATRKAIAGISFKLPAGVTPLTCDGGSCPSQGTNLPNGTRFTVAARGKGQLLPDFRGAILTDANGKEFTMKQTTIGGVYGYEYVGNFTGSTGGGYTFTAMRGVLVPVNDSLAIEFNHFAPAGTTSDFAKDDALFDKIVGTFMTNFPTPTISTALPTSAIVSPSAVPASSSGTGF